MLTKFLKIDKISQFSAALAALYLPFRLVHCCELRALQTKPTKPNLPNQTHLTKPNLPNQTYQTYQTNQTKPTKPNVAYQAYLTMPTKPKLLVKAVNAWVRSAFGNVYQLSLFLGLWRFCSLERVLKGLAYQYFTNYGTFVCLVMFEGMFIKLRRRVFAFCDYLCL